LRILTDEQLPVYERLGDVRERAVTMGRIADILYRRGDLDEALRIRQQEELPVYERLGDVRERALAMGKIADILLQKGDPIAARHLQEERLETHQQMADSDGTANALWNLAQIDLAERKIGDAVPRIVEAYNINSKLGRADGIAVVGMVLGQILAAGGQLEAARLVLQRSAEMFLKLGQEKHAEEAEDLIRQLGLEQ
jgi:tetratricopeptide (TPR) repeat protein